MVHLAFMPTNPVGLTPMTVALIMMDVGAVLIIIHFLRAPARPYLPLLGLALLVFAPSLLVPPPYQWMLQLLALLPVVLACREALRDCNARVQRFREETREREQAFGEYLRSTIGRTEE